MQNKNQKGVALFAAETTGKRDKKGKMRNGCVQAAEHFLFLSVFHVVIAVTKESHPNQNENIQTPIYNIRQIVGVWNLLFEIYLEFVI
ncbi:MAG: hypothetical protein GY749_09080 [Desulfobacteraceae bacterium]|nr:hypothetical protein [Desulfobacteraceae bacterium]